MANRPAKIVTRRVGLQNQQASSSSSRCKTIVNKTTPKKSTSPKKNLKQKISSILVEFKEDSGGEIDPFARKIMKVFDEFATTQRTNGQPSTSGLASSGSPKTPVATTQTSTKTSTKTTTTVQTNSENFIFLTPRLTLSRVIEDARCSGKKVSPELRRLMPSNGYVFDETGPAVRRSKRTVKPVVRFGDIDFDASKNNSVQRSSSVLKKTIQKKAVHVKKTPTQNSITIHKQTMSVTQSGPNESRKFHFMKKLTMRIDIRSTSQ